MVIVWIVLVLLALVVLVVRLSSTGPIDFSWRFGSIYSASSESPTHEVTREQLVRAVEELLRGTRFDTLWVAGIPDLWAGLGVSRVSGGAELSTGYNESHEQENLEAFLQAFERLGYEVSQQPGVYNGGMAPENRETHVEVVLPNDAEKIVEAIVEALKANGENIGEMFFAYGWMMPDFTKSKGFHYIPKTDPLGEFLKDL